MKFSITILSLAASLAVGTPTPSDEKCSGWDPATLPEGTDVLALERCEKHPAELGITSPLYDPEAKEEDLTSAIQPNELVDGALDKRGLCPASSGRGHGSDYDYGCDGGWCWRNCNGPFITIGGTKTWCWLAYEGGGGGYTPCGRWQDCEWSYNNKNAKCKKGSCGSCGCGC